MKPNSFIFLSLFVIFLHFVFQSFSFIVFVFFPFLSCSSFFFHFSFIFFHLLSFSFIFFHFLSFFLSLDAPAKSDFFLGLNFVTISHDSSYVKKSILGPISEGTVASQVLTFVGDLAGEAWSKPGDCKGSVLVR